MEQSSIICPHCQTLNPARNLYCQSCGKTLVQAASVAPNLEGTNANPTALSRPVDPQPPFPLSDYPAVGQSMPPQGQPVPSQGIPPQGMPQPGYPPQGMPPQGMPPQPPQGYSPQGMPPQQGYYPPPPPPPAPRPPAAPVLEHLGVRVEGWADLITGAGDQAQEVQHAFVESFNARQLPMVRLEPIDFSSGGMKKPYWVVRTQTESTTVQIEAKGKDLFLGWSQYVKRTLNWQMIGILAAIAFGVSFLTSLSLIGSFGFFILNWFFGTFNWLLPVVVIALIVGYVWKGSFWYFFLQEPGEMMKADRTALMLAVHQSLSSACEKAGLDSEALRKNEFQVGNRDRKI